MNYEVICPLTHEDSVALLDQRFPAQSIADDINDYYVFRLLATEHNKFNYVLAEAGLPISKAS